MPPLRPSGSTLLKAGIVISFLLICGLLATWDWLHAYNEVTPPARVTDMHSFLLEMPRPDAVYELHIDGLRFTEFEGPLPSSIFALPSGPPSYVFDESGRLVDFSPDTGDDPNFITRWHTSAPRHRLDGEGSHRVIEQALENTGD